MHRCATTASTGIKYFTTINRACLQHAWYGVGGGVRHNFVYDRDTYLTLEILPAYLLTYLLKQQ